MSKKETRGPSPSFTVGAIALAFLVTGYQTALLVHRAAVLSVVDKAVFPDTVYVYSPPEPVEVPPYREVRKSGAPGKYSPVVKKTRDAFSPRSYESFPFNPNEAGTEDLMRLGFTLSQAEAIAAYREKGGRFHRKEDFAKSFVVSDSIYRRLESYIRIPLLDLNRADSAAFDGLPGIGPYFAARMVALRDALGGYSCKEQLLDIYRFDEQRLSGIADLVTVGPSEPFRLWSAPEDSLALHPYIGRHAAHSIVLFRRTTPPSLWSVEELRKAGILSSDLSEKLSKCRLENPGLSP